MHVSGEDAAVNEGEADTHRQTAAHWAAHWSVELAASLEAALLRAMKFKVLLRKRGGARARAVRLELVLEIRPSFDDSCFLCLEHFEHLIST